MGSINITLPVSLAALNGENASDAPTDAIVETIWAITQFIYTSENAVDFVCYSERPSEGFGDATGRQSLSSIRRYHVSKDATPAEIAMMGCEMVHEDLRAQELEPYASVPVFTQLIRRTGLLFIQEGVGLEPIYELGKYKLVSPCFQPGQRKN
jgi:hypothetical protein